MTFVNLRQSLFLRDYYMLSHEAYYSRTNQNLLPQQLTWVPHTWMFGSNDFFVSIRGFSGSMLLFEGVDVLCKELKVVMEEFCELESLGSIFDG